MDIYNMKITSDIQKRIISHIFSQESIYLVLVPNKNGFSNLVFYGIKNKYGDYVYYSYKAFYYRQDIDRWIKLHLVLELKNGVYFVCDPRDGSVGILK